MSLPAPTPKPEREPASAAAAERRAKLWGLSRHGLGHYVFGAALLALFHFFTNRIDWLSKHIIDGLFHHHRASLHNVRRPLAILVGLALFACLARLYGRRAFLFAARDVEHQLRGRILRRLHRLGRTFYAATSAGDIMSRATGDLANVRILFDLGILGFVNFCFVLVSASQVMLAISPTLFAVALGPYPIVIIVMGSLWRKTYRRTLAHRQAAGQLTNAVAASLAGKRLIRSHGCEPLDRERFQKANQRYARAGFRLAGMRKLTQLVLGSAASLTLLGIFAYGAVLVVRGKGGGGITKGGFFAFVMATGRLLGPIAHLGVLLSMLQRGRASFSRLLEILDAEPDVTDGPLPAPERALGHLQVAGLSFAYKKTQVLRDVAFDLPPGASLAIVGRSGSGKSTLGLLLARLLPTPRGAVFLDGQDVCDLPLTATRGAVRYAQQDAFLFSRTVAGNVGLALGHNGAEAERTIRRALSAAQMLDEASALAQGLETLVGAKGVQLSGGQRQRVALARNLAELPSILVLDDPFSAVDAQTERAALDALLAMRQGRSLVLIAHRIAAASRCDRVLVLEKGVVVEAGTPDELLASGGIYAAFAEEQRLIREVEDAGVKSAGEAEA